MECWRIIHFLFWNETNVYMLWSTAVQTRKHFRRTVYYSKQKKTPENKTNPKLQCISILMRNYFRNIRRVHRFITCQKGCSLGFAPIFWSSVLHHLRSQKSGHCSTLYCSYAFASYSILISWKYDQRFTKTCIMYSQTISLIGHGHPLYFSRFS